MPEQFTSALFDTFDFEEKEEKKIGQGIQVTVFFATESGNARECASFVSNQLRKQGFEVATKDLANVSLDALGECGWTLFCVSTRSEEETPGDKSKPARPPQSAATFWQFLKAAPMLDLSGVRYAMLALGDRSYKDFCGFGRMLDERLRSLGARPLLERVDCDVAYGENLKKWAAEVGPAIVGKG